MQLDAQLLADAGCHQHLTYPTPTVGFPSADSTTHCMHHHHYPYTSCSAKRALSISTIASVCNVKYDVELLDTLREGTDGAFLSELQYRLYANVLDLWNEVSATVLKMT